MKKSTKVALGGMIAALCVLLFLLTGILPFLTYVAPMLSGMLMVVMVIECGGKWAFMVYLAVSLLAILVSPDKAAAFVFVFFLGFYPIIKGRLDHMKIQLFAWLIKLAMFNLCVLAAYLLMIYVLQMPDVMTEMGGLGRYTGVVTLGVANVVFVMMDSVLARLARVYLVWFRPKFLRKVG